MLTLVTGGARSGKSSFAQNLCGGSDDVVYIATAGADDEEMADRIRKHQASRPASWRLVEERKDLAGAIRIQLSPSRTLLVDCITLWISNLLLAAEDRVEQSISEQTDNILTLSSKGKLILVTNEVGCGIVPDSALGRRFRDLQGWANQRLAAGADAVYWMVSGVPVCVKGRKENHV